ncbi:MAG: hypothetical protein HY912_10890 [Desulfomonile tiedjei]|uniref:Uncharacterized protein n=1 Tax=Desulfomonile tiedjei TaxID=2358 RepID=A0A9D6Z3K3_9BACT|nr:hypothetical protein [Desulfomonile tiedjei]
MTVLFTQSWDTVPGKFDEYSEFATHEYNPTLEKLGMKLLGGYYVAVGQGPRIIAVATVKEQGYLRKILATEEYRVISAKLMQLVREYSSRLWVSTGRLVEEPYSIHTGAWKFNQYYNVVPGKEKEHYQFVKEECIPGMKELKVPITGAWRLVIGNGPTTLGECTARKIVDIANAIDTSEFRRLVRKIKKDYAMDFSSRILAPTGRIEVPEIMKEMMKGF